MRPPILQPLVPGLFLLEAEKDGRFPYSHAFAAVVDARDRSILELLDRPLTIGELTAASPIYCGRAYAPGVLDDWEGQMIRKHLERQGRVAREEPEAAQRGGSASDAGGAVTARNSAVEPERAGDRTRWSRR